VPPGTASIRVGVRFLNSSTPPGGEPEPSGPGGGLLDDLSLRVSAPLPAARLVPPRSAGPRFGHVFMIMMENTTRYDHYSAARTIEQALGVAPFTANDAYATPFNDVVTRRRW
jgi:hypothetical protein